MTARTSQHPDEERVVEDHHQTEHKLDVMRRYFGAYPSIIARARNIPNNRECWIVDTHAGAGLHRSRDDPDGRRYGSPLIACSEAQVVQRLNQGFKVHIRAIEKEREWVLRLSNRVEPFRNSMEPRHAVDVQVIAGDFTEKIESVLAEARARHALSLWFVDPFGFKDIPFRALEPLTCDRYGPELVINLDLSGIYRVKGAAHALADVASVLYAQPSQQETLNELFGGNRWQNVLVEGMTYRDSLQALAEAYAETFSTFQHRSVYPLRTSDGQVRFLIHLTHAERARVAFQKAYSDSWKVGLLAGKTLTVAAKATAAEELFNACRGRTTSIDMLYEEGIRNLDRTQLKAVCREAERRGYGHFDELEMTWRSNRVVVEQTQLF